MARATQAKTLEVLKIVPCKFAFDRSDPYCANCNGMEIEVEEGDAVKKVPATGCGAYTPTDGVVEQPVVVDVPETETEVIDPADSADENTGTLDDVAQDDTIEPEPVVVQPKSNVKVTTTLQSKPIPKTPKPPVTPKVIAPPPVEVDVAPSIDELQEDVITEITAESGVSFEIKDRSGVSRWYKFTYTETRTVNPYVDIEEQRRNLWNDVNGVVDSQVDETVAMLKEQ